ncbi:MAG: 23S rRNA (guanosine(2251)-2'-O)-methyltransferase RlmB [Gammaproteobacteria bacterium]|nr:23S rRNA (guanosine(2251)-2'-O)-methyltransferase RlmB [Gammaproteobacteria bacterium]MDH3750937.1 23S rRNA (guanosine(2251)-2'-O)-methyltransferase RlmB [Gammaproteobacteria bacterium]MDH3805020.1 23S rRNA (guanosine(2251)-2'-O)-methyltransferase RlmB [Gammaproteobacteria bacterium]
MSKSQYVTGLRAVEQLMATKKSDVRRVYAEYQTANPRVEALIAQANNLGIEVQAANRARLKQIGGEVRHQGIVAEVRRSTNLDEAGLRSLVEERLQDSEKSPLLLLLLDGVQDPHNLGACMRTADATGVDAIIAPRHGAAGLTSTVSKVAAGAAEHVPFAAVGNLARVLGWLTDYGVFIVGTSDAGAASLYDTDLDRPLALVMGREHTGLGKRIEGLCDELISLPMQGAVSSLNVSVATGICLYEVLRQRQRGSRPDS